MTERVGVWFLADGRLHWFAFCERKDALHIADRLRRLFQCPTVIQGYWWESR